MVQKQAATAQSSVDIGRLEESIGLKQLVKAPAEPKQAAATSKRPRFTIVLPAFNEELRIGPALEALKREFRDEAEILVVDDGSSDRTSQVAESFGVKVIRHASNMGKGAAVKTGFIHAQGDVVGFVDADNSTSAGDVRHVFEKAEEKGAAVGSRHGGAPNTTVKREPMRKFAAWVFRKAVKALGGVDVEDTQCGCKAFEKRLAGKIAERLDVQGWIFDIKVLRIVKDEGYPANEVNISWTDKPGSKIRLARDGPIMLMDLIKMRIRE